MSENKKLYEELRRLKEELPHGGIYSSSPYQNVLIYLATTLIVNAKVIVELGTGAGNSTDAFLEGLKITGGILYSIDANPADVKVKTTIDRLKNHPQFRFLVSDSVKAAKGWQKTVDILLCDSDHSYKHVLAELEAWGKYSKIIYVHDIIKLETSYPLKRKKAPPYEACTKYAEKTGRIFYPLTGFGCGLGIVIRKS